MNERWTRRGLLRVGGVSMLAGLGACTASRPETTAASVTTDIATPSSSLGPATSVVHEARFRSTAGPYVNALQVGVPADGETDVTIPLQQALADAEGGVLHIPTGRYRINTDPTTGGSLEPPSDTTITLDAGTVIEGIPNAVEFSYVFLLDGVERVAIRGGTIVGDRESHESDTGEQGHLIAIFQSTDILISDVTLTEAWGDGILIGYGDEPGTESRRVAVTRVRSVNNRRLGMSVIGGRDISISDSTFAATAGTQPAAGIDLEPEPGFEVSDVVIHGCRFVDNEGDGLLLGGLPSDGAIRGVTIASSVSERNGIDGVACFAATGVTIDGLVSRRNTKAGLSLSGATDVEVLAAICTENGDQGILADPGVDGLNLTASTVTRNTSSGLQLRPGTRRARINAALIADNGAPGLDLRGTESTTIDNTTITGNLDAAITLDECPDTSIQGCSVRAHPDATGPTITSISSPRLQVLGNRLEGNGALILSLGGGDKSTVVIAANTLSGAPEGGLRADDAEVRDNTVI